MQKKLIASFALALLLGLVFLTGTILSGMECAGLSRWSATNPPVNQHHVFCGEWKERKNRPSGFHSRPAGENPSTIGTIQITQQPNLQGIYGVRWSYAGHPDREKFSSMFPDTCDREQILKSIVYAAGHPKPCPQGSPRWAKCGSNKPIYGGHGYCEASNNSIFTIAFATLKNSDRINTAFPLIE
jgi:hypothetical protein